MGGREKVVLWAAEFVMIPDQGEIAGKASHAPGPPNLQVSCSRMPIRASFTSRLSAVALV